MGDMLAFKGPRQIEHIIRHLQVCQATRRRFRGTAALLIGFLVSIALLLMSELAARSGKLSTIEFASLVLTLTAWLLLTAGMGIMISRVMKAMRASGPSGQ